MFAPWHILGVVVVVLIPLGCAAEYVYGAGNAEQRHAEGHPTDELMRDTSQEDGAKISVTETLDVVMTTLLQDETAEEYPQDGFMKMPRQTRLDEDPVELMRIVNALKGAAGLHPSGQQVKDNAKVRDLTEAVLDGLMEDQNRVLARLPETLQSMKEIMPEIFAPYVFKEVEEHGVTERETLDALQELFNKAVDAAGDHYTRKIKYFFNANYVKVLAAAKGWKDNSLRETIVPLVYKVGLSYIVLKTNYTVLRSMLGRPVDSIEDETLSDPCARRTVKNCRMARGLLRVAGVAATTAGHLSEACVRTVLFSDADKFKVLDNELFSVLTKTLSTSLVMLKYVLERAVNFKNAVSARYLRGPIPVSGTEGEFVKASDQLFAAFSDFAVLSSNTLEYGSGAILLEKKPEIEAVFPVLLDSYNYVVKRGIPEDYRSSPYPPLSYYWDMAALQHAVSVLSDIEGLAERTLQEQKGGTQSFIVDKKSVTKTVTAVHGLLTLISEKVKGNELQAALSSATEGVQSVMSTLEEAGVELMKDDGSETVPELLGSLLKIITSSRPATPLSLGTLPSIPIKLSLRKLFSLIPTDYDMLMTMVANPAVAIFRGAEGLRSSAQKMSASHVKEEPDLRGTADSKQRFSIVKPPISNFFMPPKTDNFFPLLMNGLQHVMPIFVYVLKDCSSEVTDVFEEADGNVAESVERILMCLLSDCKRDLHLALSVTCIIAHDPEMLQRWETTRSNPLFELTEEESYDLFARLHATFGSMPCGLPNVNVGSPAGASPTDDRSIVKIIGSKILFGVKRKADASINTKEANTERRTET